MSPETIRQAALALVARSPRSEWVSGSQICDVLLGRPYQDGDYHIGDLGPDGKRDVGPRWEIDAELKKMVREGLLVVKSHGGYRLPD